MLDHIACYDLVQTQRDTVRACFPCPATDFVLLRERFMFRNPARALWEPKSSLSCCFGEKALFGRPSWCVTSLKEEQSDYPRICSKRITIRITCAKQIQNTHFDRNNTFSRFSAPGSEKHDNICSFRCVINGVPADHRTLPYVRIDLKKMEIWNWWMWKHVRRKVIDVGLTMFRLP